MNILWKGVKMKKYLVFLIGLAIGVIVYFIVTFLMNYH